MDMVSNEIIDLTKQIRGFKANNPLWPHYLETLIIREYIVMILYQLRLLEIGHTIQKYIRLTSCHRYNKTILCAYMDTKVYMLLTFKITNKIKTKKEIAYILWKTLIAYNPLHMHAPLHLSFA